MELDRLRMERADLQKEINLLKQKEKVEKESTYVLLMEENQQILSTETKEAAKPRKSKEYAIQP